MSALALDKTKIRRSFAAAAHSYDGLAGLQRRVGLELLGRFPLAAETGILLDLGSGTGFLTQELAKAAPGEQLVALDIALPMLQTSRLKHPDMPAQYLCADAEKLPFTENSIARIYSNLALQWLENLPSVFADCRRILRADGQLVFATFGPSTLHELKTAWAAVDGYTHVNAFYSLEQIRAFLQAAGFDTVGSDSQLYQYQYPTVMALMQELKGIGAHNVSLARNPKPTTKSQLHRMISHYQALMPGADIIASYEIIIVQARF